MPFSVADRRVAAELVREIRELAGLVRRISTDEDAPPHPEIKAALESFRRINKALAAGNGPSVVTLRRKVQVGREFEKLGAALRGRTKR